MPEHPWDRQPGETDSAYQAFELFRRLGPDRTVQAAWEQYWGRPGTRRKAGGKQAGMAHGYFRAWSSRHRWHERAVAWDDELAALARDQELDRELKARVAQQQEQIRQRQLMREEARAARAVGRRCLLRIIQEIEGRQLDSMKLAELIPHLKRFLDAVTEGQRLEKEMGEPPPATRQLDTRTERALAELIRDYVPQAKWELAAEEFDRIIALDLGSRPADTAP